MYDDQRYRGIISMISGIQHSAVDWIVAELAVRGVVGVVPTHGHILTALYAASGSLQMQQITQQIGRSKSTVTQLVAGLEKSGYVTRRKDVVDGRVTHVELTDKGCALQGLWWDLSQQLIGEAWKGFSEVDRSLLMDLLERLAINFKSEGSVNG